MAQENNTEQLADIKDSDIKTNFDERAETFDAMNLKSELLRGIYGYGFEKPSVLLRYNTGKLSFNSRCAIAYYRCFL